MAIPTTTNLEDLLARTRSEWVAEQIDALPSYDTAEERLQAVKAILAESYDRSRARMAGVMPMGPDSMVGSYFRAPDPNDTVAESSWLDGEPCATVEGIVVAQPFTSSTTAMYLVEFYGPHGASGHQELVELDRMLMQRWAFYDNDAWLAGRRQAGEAALVPADEDATSTVPDDGAGAEA